MKEVLFQLDALTNQQRLKSNDILDKNEPIIEEPVDYSML
jgi:hypothetical protein